MEQRNNIGLPGRTILRLSSTRHLWHLEENPEIRDRLMKHEGEQLDEKMIVRGTLSIMSHF
jgi:hypothetical protein